MKLRRVLSVLLAVLIVASCTAIIGTVAASGADVNIAAAGSAYSDMLAKTTAANKYGLSETVNDGTILQAWNWSFANIEANLETVAEQGFTTIQVSPPNEIKMATKNVSLETGTNGWWMYYQPVGFQINQSTDNALGTKSEFVSMTTKAHQLGLKVIVDAVINHVGTKDGTPDSDSSVMNHVNDKVKTFEPELYNNQLFHSPWKKMEYIESNNTQYNSTYDLTRNCTSGLPDLKTEDQRVQNMIYDYLEELVAAGADGFRFDAAKHIETPDDISSLASDFWTDTLVKVQKAHSDKEIYAYGEILNSCGIGRPYSMYTKLFDVTDSGSYWAIKNAVTGSGDANATPYYPSSNFTSANTVLWDESHDTYVDGSTTGLTTLQRGKIWALVAGRSGISTVYLARPDDSTNTNSFGSIKLGEARKTAWSNATTKAINQFHNYFIGQSEYCTNNSGGTAYIERGTTGAMIVNLGGTTSKSVTLTNHKLTAGTYKDAITGNTFTVTNAQIKGNVGTTGVAVIYENNETPTEAPTDPPITYILGDVNNDGVADVLDATMILRYAVDMISFDDKQLMAGDVDGDGFVTVIDATFIQRYDAKMTVKYDIGQEKSSYKPEPTTPYVQPTTPYVQPTTPYVQPTTPVITNDSFLLTDNFGWGTAYVYAWDANGTALNGEWPGASQAEVVTNGYGETQFKCYIPEGAVGVILNNGNGAQTEDITDFSYDGYWMDGTQNSEGHYIVTGWNSDDPDPTPNPTTAPTPQPSGSFLLTDNFGWGTAYVYAWDANGTALNGEWPGASQAEVVTNGYGETQFKCYIPEGAVGVILNNGNGAQTEDITDFSYDGYWMDGTQNSEGHYIVTGWNEGDDPTPTPDPTTAPTPDPSTDGIYLAGSFNDYTTSSAYQFTENSAAPGEYMLSTTLTAGDSLKVVKYANGTDTWYPDGMDNDYVVDAAHAGAVTIYFKDTYQADWAAFGGYMYIDNGSAPTPDPDPTSAPAPQPSGSFLLTDNFGWGTAYVYAWDANGTALNGEWPGASQAETIVNGYGETQFRCYVPEGAVGVILSNGNGAQTEDITDFSYDGYWMDGTQNNQGHYIVTGWNEGDDPTPTPGPQPSATTLTLVPGVWNQGVERYAAYFFGNGETWVSLNSDNTVTVPDGYTSVIFVRMNGATSDNSWDNKWNQTSDLTIPSGGGTYTITGWGESDGHW